VLGTLVSRAETDELIEMPFAGLTQVDLGNHVLDDWGSSSPRYGAHIPSHCNVTAFALFSLRLWWKLSSLYWGLCSDVVERGRTGEAEAEARQTWRCKSEQIEIRESD